MRIFSVNAWRFAVSVGVGKWDRFTSWGNKVKDGIESVFDSKTLGQMVDNFALRKNDIAMCYDHQSAYTAENGQPAPALAFYNALALVVDGKVEKFATHSDAVQPPDPAGLENGIYGHRGELTPLGEKLLPNYKYLSPMFTDQGADEQGNPVGYDLIDVAATNTPFQDGVGLSFHKTGSAEPPAKKERFSMDPELMKKLGLADGCSADEMKGAMAKYMTDTEEKLAKYAADEAEKMGDEDKDAETMADDDDEDKKAMSQMAKDLGLDPKSKPKAILAAYSAKTASMTDLAKVRQELDGLRAEREAEKKSALEVKYAELADRGIAAGYSKEKRDNLIAFARSDFKAASEFVESLPGAKVMTRLTYGGAPVGAERTQSNGAQATNGVVKMGRGLSDAIKTYRKANPNASYEAAASAVAKANPELVDSYLQGN